MIKNVVFDIGDVLMTYHWNYVLEMGGLSEEESNRVGWLIFADPLWTDMDLGKVNLSQARILYREKYPEDATAIDYFLDHPEMMPVPRPDIWEYARKLKEKGYKLYVLSNYSEELLKIHTGTAEFWKYMDGGIVSYQVGICKPNPEIYQALLHKYELVPEECIFFDDRPENVEGAIALGMQSVCITGRDVLVNELEKLLHEENE